MKEIADQKFSVTLLGLGINCREGPPVFRIPFRRYRRAHAFSTESPLFGKHYDRMG